MHHSLARDVSSYVDWLDAGRAAADEHIETLSPLPLAHRVSWLQANPNALTFQMCDRLLDLAHHELDRDPPAALALTAFVLRHADAVTAPSGAETALVYLRGRARKEHGNALRLAGDLAGALEMFRNAASIFEKVPPLVLEVAAARRGEALILHELGDPDRALRMIREGAALFAAHGDARGEVRSRVYEGAVLFEANRVEEAAATFDRALASAVRINDEETISRIYNNLGHCAQMLHDRGRAVQYLARALSLFEEHGMATERLRAVLGLAQLLADEGLVDRAIAELTAVRRDLLAAGLPLQAASAALDALEILSLANRGDRLYELASDLVNEFARAGLLREAMRALSFVRDLAGRGTLTAAAIGEAGKFVRRLVHDRQARFAIP